MNTALLVTSGFMASYLILIVMLIMMWKADNTYGKEAPKQKPKLEGKAADQMPNLRGQRSSTSGFRGYVDRR